MATKRDLVEKRLFQIMLSATKFSTVWPRILDTFEIHTLNNA